MTATLSLFSATVAYGDTSTTTAPNMKFVDWKRQFQSIPVKNPKTEGVSIPAGAERLIFDGSRTLTLDNTTTVKITLNPLAPDRYRIMRTAGTALGLRQARAVDLTGIELTVTTQANASLLIEAATGTPFAALQVGDEVFIPGLTTGDAENVISMLNEGRWVVLGQAGSSVTLIRPAGEDFMGIGQVVTPTAADQFLAFSPDGVQAGDKLEISAGFALPTQKSFEVAAATSDWVEILSTTPLPVQSNVAPGAAGMRVYSGAKRFLRIEADQECVVRANGDTGSSQRMSPWTAGDPAQVAEYIKVGPAWSLSVLNKSATTLHLTIITAE